MCSFRGGLRAQADQPPEIPANANGGKRARDQTCEGVLMNLGELLANLRKERDAIDAAIRALECLGNSRWGGASRLVVLPENRSKARAAHSHEPIIGEG
jgi:hypothetical protein